jgi:hypothetical protein
MLAGGARAQSNQMQHPAPTATQAAPPTANETEVVWLRRRVEQLEAQLATCAPDAKGKMKRKKDSSMPMGSMGDDKMGGDAMGAMPPSDPPKAKMKPKKDSAMPAAPMGDDQMGGGHM